DGPEPLAAVKAGDRGDRRLRGRRRHGARAMGGYARGGGRRDLRHLLPPLRRAADRSRHHPPAAPDRTLAGDRFVSDRAAGRRPGGASHGARQPPGAEGRDPRACDCAGEGHRRIPANLPACRSPLGAAAVGPPGRRCDRQRDAWRARGDRLRRDAVGGDALCLRRRTPWRLRGQLMTMLNSTTKSNTFTTADFRLQSGTVMPEVTIAYRTLGTLSPAHDTVVLVTHGNTSGQQMIEPGGS